MAGGRYKGCGTDSPVSFAKYSTGAGECASLQTDTLRREEASTTYPGCEFRTIESNRFSSSGLSQRLAEWTGTDG
jgi:hypothetical protein